MAEFNVPTLDASGKVRSKHLPEATAPTSILKPRGNWAAATAYVVNDLVHVDGRAFYCIVAHTSGAAATAPTATNTQWRFLSEMFLSGVNFTINQNADDTWPVRGIRPPGAVGIWTGTTPPPQTTGYAIAGQDHFLNKATAATA